MLIDVEKQIYSAAIQVHLHTWNILIWTCHSFQERIVRMSISSLAAFDSRRSHISFLSPLPDKEAQKLG